MHGRALEEGTEYRFHIVSNLLNYQCSLEVVGQVFVFARQSMLPDETNTPAPSLKLAARISQSHTRVVKK